MKKKKNSIRNETIIEKKISEKEQEKNLKYLLDILEKELDYERIKKENLENKASWILALLGVMFSIIVEGLNFSEITKVNRLMFLKIFLLISLILLMMGILILLIFVIKPVKGYLQLNMKKMNKENFEEKGIRNIEKIINNRKELKEKYRIFFEKKGNFLIIILWLILVLISLMLIFKMTL